MTATKLRRLPFSPSMLKAWRDGLKTQTRRVIVPQPEDYDFGPGGIKPAFLPPFILPGYKAVGVETIVKDKFAYVKSMPYGCPGDTLAIAERHRYLKQTPTQITVQYGDQNIKRFRFEDLSIVDWGTAANRKYPLRWQPSRYMPNWAAREFAELLEVRAERVQDVTPHDADAEGMDRESDDYKEHGPSWCFRETWDQLNAKRGYGWDANPWVWVLKLRRITEQPQPAGEA